MKNNVFYKRWKASNLETSVFQLIVPRSRIKQILEETHDFPTGGYFGVNKTLEKIRAICK